MECYLLSVYAEHELQESQLSDEIEDKTIKSHDK